MRVDWQSLISQARAALLGISAYDNARAAYEPSQDSVDQIRKAIGGNLAPLPITQTRWLQADRESAITQADTGNLARAARLHRSMRSDGVINGLLSSCTDGLVRLPKRFYGNAEQVEALQTLNGSASVFDEMCPPAELAAMAADGRVLGVALGELVPVPGRTYPVLVRLDPEWLVYRWSEGRWYYSSMAGPLPITPGDGRWVLHVPGGRISPWHHGIWMALGRAWINKEHALLYRSNYGAKLAHPARVAFAPAGATNEERASLLQRVMAWGMNTVFAMPIGYDVKLLESNGRGHDVWKEDIESCDNEIMIAIAGQIVTTTGGAGFANADIHKSIRSDIIQSIADALAYTINTQILPAWCVAHYGPDALTTRAVVAWDVRPAKDMNAEATTLVQVANAIDALRRSLRAYGYDVDLAEMKNRFGIPVVELEADTDDAGVKLTLAPTDIAKVVRVDEARASQGLGPIGDERGALTIQELTMPEPAPAPLDPASPLQEAA